MNGDFIFQGFSPKQPPPALSKDSPKLLKNSSVLSSLMSIVPQLSKCLKFEAVCGVLTDQMI